MEGERKSLFIFLMGLAWKFRLSMPLLLSGTVAMLGRAWMFQIRVQTVEGIHENQVMSINVVFFLLTDDLQLALDEVELRRQMGLDGINEYLAYYDDDEEVHNDESSNWESSSSSSWETLTEEEAFG